MLGVEASLIDILLNDHHELRAKAAAIKAGGNDQVDSFCGLLEQHIRTEERHLFVLAENRMTPGEMAELGRQIKARLSEGGSKAKYTVTGWRQQDSFAQWLWATMIPL